MIQVGKPAPNFIAPAYYNGEMTEVNLEDYRGKWVVLFFYPGDFTFVWTTEVSAVADRYEEFQKLGAEILTISVDSTFVHKVWNDEEISQMIGKDIPFPMLQDKAGTIGTEYGVYDAEGGVDIRGRYIIDPDGIVQTYEVLTPPIGRNIDETIRQIEAAKFVREVEAKEVTPAGWEPGKKTLKPGNDLVGKVWKEWDVKKDQ